MNGSGDGRHVKQEPKVTDIESTIPDLEQEKKTIERVLDKTRLVGHGPDEFEGLGNAGWICQDNRKLADCFVMVDMFYLFNNNGYRISHIVNKSLYIHVSASETGNPYRRADSRVKIQTLFYIILNDKVRIGQLMLQ